MGSALTGSKAEQLCNKERKTGRWKHDGGGIYCDREFFMHCGVGNLHPIN